MKQICVVTGGGSGMGLEAAKILGKDHQIILVGRTITKLEKAVVELRNMGIEAEAYSCSVTDKESVQRLAEYAASLGTVRTVIHSAGVSPKMTSPDQIFEINAIGTINIDQAFAPIIPTGGCILNVSSMSAYMISDSMVPKQMYMVALDDADAFKVAGQQYLEKVPEDKKCGMAYTISKNFVIWYTSKMALQYGPDIRIVSISPGTFDTPMQDVEGDGATAYGKQGALKRVGDPTEIAKMMAFMVSAEASYLTGVDVLYDGGAIAAFNEKMENRA